MEMQGVTYSVSHINGLAGAMGDLADRFRETAERYDTTKAAARTALSDDDYGRAYWQANGPRLEAIGLGLRLLVQAAQREEARLSHASFNYREADPGD
ncbi:hypothetical protein GCM10010149_67990 [Nonomuraea roseoviolacea subsp. roseoviolacea]|uniref:WXG100 family type VII secretion target n=1 Tax=Nonomuraea roseoviolacea subsp. carminata TaxID=160689 RepID=A0ABT1JX99_9ACTN|nr:hypothetical protein [Nonomuraea roseoviolacea]MCP2346388.1 hypothetical protein [Nonomuraea roseoviolacea subsp. carminata]